MRFHLAPLSLTLSDLDTQRESLIGRHLESVCRTESVFELNLQISVQF